MSAADFYEYLGVPPDADEDEIHAAYRELTKECHPDLHDQAYATKQFETLQLAKDILTDPGKRVQYDHHGHEEFVQEHCSETPFMVSPAASEEEAESAHSNASTSGSGGGTLGQRLAGWVGTIGRSTSEGSTRPGGFDGSSDTATNEYSYPGAESKHVFDVNAERGRASPGRIAGRAESLREKAGVYSGSLVLDPDTGQYRPKSWYEYSEPLVLLTGRLPSTDRVHGSIRGALSSNRIRLWGLASVIYIAFLLGGPGRHLAVAITERANLTLPSLIVPYPTATLAGEPAIAVGALAVLYPLAIWAGRRHSRGPLGRFPVTAVSPIVWTSIAVLAGTYIAASVVLGVFLPAIGLFHTLQLTPSS